MVCHHKLMIITLYFSFLLFVSAMYVCCASVSMSWGVVYCYRGRNSQWSVMQTLSPHSQSLRETYTNIDSYFGGDIAATVSTLVVGCQNCNSSESTPRQGGEVYVYTPDPHRQFWSASQILTATNVKFLGEHVALHDDLLVATADEALPQGTAQYITSFPTRAVIFQRPEGKRKGKKEGKGNPKRESDGGRDKFQQQQVLIIPNSATYIISEIAVYDETIVLSASVYSYSNNPNEIYIYTPNTLRFGRAARVAPEGKGKGKEKPQAVSMQWSLHQTLTTPVGTQALNFYLSIQGNSLVYTSWDSTHDQVIVYKRSSLPGQWQHTGVSGVDVFETAGGTSDLFATVTPQHQLFFVNLGTASALFKPIDLNPGSFHCLQIFVGDHFGDGWDTAELTVEAPGGYKTSYSPGCDTPNPLLYRYCPLAAEDIGVYKFRMEHVKEATFPWEIMWKVYDERTKQWYFGTHLTQMDFEWSAQFTDFSARRMEHLHLNASACSLCPTTPPQPKSESESKAKPKPKPHPSITSTHLRSLHGKGTTASPTLSPAPTIAVTGLDSSDSLYFHMSNAATETSPWFDSENSGTQYFISDVEGTELYSTGTSCVNGVTEVSCWAELPDGEYVARVGGALDASINRQWKFCGGIHYQSKQTELYFSVKYGVCTPSLARSQANVCNNVLKVTTLYVEILLSGNSMLSPSSSPSFSSELKQVVISYMDNLLYKKLGQPSVSVQVVSTTFQDADVTVGLHVGLHIVSDGEVSSLLSVLEDGGWRTTSSSSPQHSEYGIEHMSVRSMRFLDEEEDWLAVDESGFQLVTDFVSSEDKHHEDDNVGDSGGHGLEEEGARSWSQYFTEWQHQAAGQRLRSRLVWVYAGLVLFFLLLLVLVGVTCNWRSKNKYVNKNETSTEDFRLMTKTSMSACVDEVIVEEGVTISTDVSTVVVTATATVTASPRSPGHKKKTKTRKHSNRT